MVSSDIHYVSDQQLGINNFDSIGGVSDENYREQLVCRDDLVFEDLGTAKYLAVNLRYASFRF